MPLCPLCVTAHEPPPAWPDGERWLAAHDDVYGEPVERAPEANVGAPEGWPTWLRWEPDVWALRKAEEWAC